MPRKRATKTKTASIAKVQEPAAKDFNDTEEKELLEQLDMQLSFFDNYVKETKRNIEKDKKRWSMTIKQRFEQLLAGIPSDVLEMPIMEYIGAGGTVESAKDFFRGDTQSSPDSVASGDDDKKSDNIPFMPVSSANAEKVARLQNLLCSGPSLQLTRVEEEDDMDEGADERKPIKQESKPQKKRITKAAMPPPSTVRKSNRKGLHTTPMTGRTARGPWGATPLITPKFNPNLPATPDNARRMKPGERLMSLAGSPILVEEAQDCRRANIGRNVRAKENIKDLLADTLSSLSPGKMEEVLKLLK